MGRELNVMEYLSLTHSLDRTFFRIEGISARMHNILNRDMSYLVDQPSPHLP